ncbi:MAG: DNA-binding response regulator [Xanthomonadaceae bacterium]|nr:DNA-binding response regulator [Xanthomonadaceae bacterium]
MIDVLLVDDHAVVREGYRRLLELQDGLRVVAEAGSAEAALLLWKQHQPSVTVVDLSLPGIGGIELIQRLRSRQPQVRCLVFSMYRDDVWVAQALKAGALGYVTKSSAPAVLVTALREVQRGRRFLSPDLAGAAIDGDGDAAHELTPREFEVLRQLLAGHPVARIAETLHLSAKTVHNLHYQIKAKLGTASDFELARIAWRRGWTD